MAKNNIILACILSALFCFSTPQASPLKNEPAAYFDCPCPHLIAHRGASGPYPDSSILAFKKALELDTDILELDVHLSKDKHIIVSHDASLMRVTGTNKRVDESTLEEIKQEDAGFSHKNENGEFSFRGLGLEVITLGELVDAFPRQRFNVEIKPNSKELAEALNTFVRERELQHRMVVASKHPDALEHYRSIKHPDAITSSHLKEIIHAYASWLIGQDLKNVSYDLLQLPYIFMNKSLVDYFHSQGLAVHVWTVNATKDIEHMLEIGVDGVMTDFPNRARDIFARKKSVAIYEKVTANQ